MSTLLPRLNDRALLKTAALVDGQWLDAAERFRQGVVEEFAEEVGWPLVIKTSRGGYDGRGVWVVESAAAALEAQVRELARDHAATSGGLRVASPRNEAQPPGA